ncbi:MAG: flotillin family protein [Coriobacteriia bacterium]|nr:flotillin family protein [Coriobacteriia bacterium]
MSFFGWLIGIFVGLLILGWLVGFRVIRNDKVGVVEKWWSAKGSLKDAIIALNGQAGYQPDVLRGGIHFRTPLMYRVHVMPLVTISQGKIAYVFARDGVPLTPGQTLGKVVPGNSFENVKAFMQGGGQRGPQRQILREGTYAFNLAQFIVITEGRIYYLPMGSPAEQGNIQMMVQHLAAVDGFNPIVIKGADDRVGIVTVNDGPSLPLGDIIAPSVGDKQEDPNYHNNFQNPEAFLAGGGYRGRQYQVLTEGTYFVNRLFATVEYINKTIVPVGFAGVVVAYHGPKGADMSGEEYRHGELVANGYRGVWNEPLMPGKYAFNTYAGSISMVPTTNIILKWIASEMGSHSYDENLSEIELITKDAFEPRLPLSVVIHIDYKKAPLVIQRFGDIKMLVNQTLDPMVSAYFKNIGQTKTLIELIQQRSDIQGRSSIDMKEKFERYNLELEEVLIGTPRSPEGDTRIEQILTQLRDRQIAVERLETYQKQKVAADKERELKESMAVAEQQTMLTQSEINIKVQENSGRAELQRAVQDAERVKTLAGADAQRIKLLADGDAERVKLLAGAEAMRIKVTAEADADKEARVGIGRAIAIEEQVRAYGGPQLQLIQEVMGRMATAIETAKIPIVPATYVQMGGAEGEDSGSNANAFGLLMTLLATEKLQTTGAAAPVDAQQVEATNAIKKAIREQMASAPQTKTVSTQQSAPSAE